MDRRAVGTVALQTPLGVGEHRKRAVGQGEMPPRKTTPSAPSRRRRRAKRLPLLQKGARRWRRRGKRLPLR
eukprot:11184130-Lingulodinium_polyedra.AAC.1